MVRLMEIRGPNFGNYDAQHIQHVQREMARSIKPNVLKQLEDELDGETLLRLLSEDQVNLSPEAKELLQKLRRDLRRKKKKGYLEDEEQQPEGFGALLETLEDLSRELEEEREKMPRQPVAQAFIPPVIQLSGNAAGKPRAPISMAPGGPAAELVGRMINYAPSNQARHHVMRELSVFGIEAINEVKSFGVRVIVLERSKALSDLKINNMFVVGPGERSFDGRPWAMVRGLYDPSRRLLVVGEELLAMRNRSCARHEFAHAYEHAYTTRKRRTHALSVELWNSFARQRTGLVSEYASTNPAEYFAESVEAFFEPGPRDYLKKADPQMYQFLCELFPAA